VQDSFIGEQLQTFALIVGLGFSIGLIYDFMMVGKNFIRVSRGTQFFIDLTFCLVITLMVFIVLLASNWGEVRAYVFIGLGGGALIYKLFFSRIVSKLLAKIFSLLIRIALGVIQPGLLVVKKVSLLIGEIKKIAGNFAMKKKE